LPSLWRCPIAGGRQSSPLSPIRLDCPPSQHALHSGGLGGQARIERVPRRAHCERGAPECLALDTHLRRFPSMTSRRTVPACLIQFRGRQDPRRRGSCALEQVSGRITASSTRTLPLPGERIVIQYVSAGGWEIRVPRCLPTKGGNGEQEGLPLSFGRFVPGGSNRAGLPLEIAIGAASCPREPGPGGRVCETLPGHLPSAPSWGSVRPRRRNLLRAARPAANSQPFHPTQ
jgi:hypothetical protein